jgi:hypothetical protein
MGALLSYRSTQRINQIRAQLNRINQQLGEFYGPMCAMLGQLEACAA